MTTLPPRFSHSRGAVLLAAGAALLWLAGCANLPAGEARGPLLDSAQLTEPTAAGPSSTQPALVAVSPVSGSESVTVKAPAAAAPIDPLRPDVKVDLEDSQAHADLWARVRKGFAMPDLDNDLVRNREQWYASRPDYVARMTERGGRYLFHIVEELDKRGMPTELALLPFIESAFNPQAMSVANASGMWQFIPSTGRDFSLKQNLFRDDRRDVLASTRAALDYLERLYKQFGDWHLALAAYNWGEGSVQRAIARNERDGLPTDYQSLRMPEETRYYVPKLQAVKNLIARPEAFSLTLPPLANHPYFLSVPIERDIDVDLAARLAGLKVDEFKQLNPQMNKPVILAAGTPQVLLPYDNASTFVSNLDKHRGPLASWTAWVATRTLRPSEAARELGISEAQLREINRIPRNMLVKVGSTLLVPRSEQRQADVPSAVADNAAMALAPDVPPLKRLNVKVGKKGETVAALAKRYRVSPSQLAAWNKVSVGGRFKAGEMVALFVPPGAAVPAVRVASANAVKPVIAHKPASAKRSSTRVAARKPAASAARVRLAQR
jgi:membrane-bound lytic murein transglycosylase D